MPVGPSPFNADFPEWYNKKRHYGNKLKMSGIQIANKFRKLISSLTGDVYKMPKHDYDKLVEYFNEHHSELSQGYKDGKKLYRQIQTPADYIDYAFEKKSQQKQIITQVCKGGHIKSLSYNALYMLLMVEFTERGDIVVFFNLPANVASTLMYHAEMNTMAPPDKNGRERHMVGVEFWNLVRVRGSIHDTRYPFEYTSDFRTGEPFGRRPGSGIHGEGNKFDYDYVEPMRKRFDKETGEEIIRSRVQVRSPKGTLFNSNVDDDEFFTEEDLSYYFDDGQYDTDIKNKSVNRKKLTKAYDTYMSENYNEPKDIVKLLRDAGAFI